MSECWCVLQFFGHWMGLVVDVLPPGRCYACILADVNQLLFCIWQMLLPIILWQMLLPLFMYFIGRCYYLLLVGWCYCLSMCCLVGGRCCCHCGYFFFCNLWNVVSFSWQMLLLSLLADVVDLLADHLLKPRDVAWKKTTPFPGIEEM